MNTMTEKQHFLTKQGFQRAKKELLKLKALKKEKTLGETPQALHSEELDAEFVSFKEDLELLESRISELECVIKCASIIPEEKKDEVDLGAKVKFVVNGKLGEFMIVGTFEADPNLGKISNESPIGQVMMGCKVGDEVSLEKVVYKIKQVKY